MKYIDVYVAHGYDSSSAKAKCPALGCHQLQLCYAQGYEARDRADSILRQLHTVSYYGSYSNYGNYSNYSSYSNCSNCGSHR